MRGSDRDKVVVIGAGLGGLAAALRLAHAGFEVTVVDRLGSPGGKLRALPSAAGPVDAGPTVLTLRWVFEALFADVGAELSAHVGLVPEATIARHWWPDGSRLDLYPDVGANEAAIGDFAGAEATVEFRRFNARAARLFEAFKGPMMTSAQPGLRSLAGRAVASLADLPAIAPPAKLATDLARSFRDPRLRQLFGRYATYVGGSPYQSPAVLALIWHAEAAGVWRIRGGMHGMAGAIARLAETRGAILHLGTEAFGIDVENGSVAAVALADGRRLPAATVVFNGDPAALAGGLLGRHLRPAVRESAARPRSLSAYVWSFASPRTAADLTHHNVFFATDPRRDFYELANGRIPSDTTLYVCAQDRGEGEEPRDAERFEIIMNAPPCASSAPAPESEFETCRIRTFQKLARMGLSFRSAPQRSALTTPSDFAALFPGSEGSIYGRSPHGFLAPFLRPRARTRVPGLYLAGGGVHPGPGMPMAVLSGRHAAAAILEDRASISAFPRTATRGGTSTDSTRTPAAPSRSSAS